MLGFFIKLSSEVVLGLEYRNVFKWDAFSWGMLRIKRMSEIVGRRVYTDSGDLFGMIEEVNLIDNKIDGWRIVVARESGMIQVLGGARGIIVPHQFIKAIGDIIIINKNAVPVQTEDEEMSLEEEELE
jgi:sporulation protein YlmC with PRC-barrel domain